MLGACGLIAPAVGQSLCSPTPKAAVASYLGRVPAAAVAAAAGSGFLVWRSWTDEQLKRQWLWVRPCDAAGRPAQLTWVPLAAPGKGQEAASAAVAAENPVVRMGDRVVVLDSEAAFSMRLSGKALQSGRRGQKIRVQLFGLRSGVIVLGIVLRKDELDLSN